VNNSISSLILNIYMNKR